MTPKLSNLNIVLGYWNENSDSCFRFNNPKQCSNWIILVSFCSSHLAIKNCYNVHLWKFKKSMQKSIFLQQIQKSLCITTKSLYTNSNFKRNYLENYNDSEHAVKTKNALFFMIFPNISFFHMIVTYWTGPLMHHSKSSFLDFVKLVWIFHLFTNF